MSQREWKIRGDLRASTFQSQKHTHPIPELHTLKYTNTLTFTPMGETKRERWRDGESLADRKQLTPLSFHVFTAPLLFFFSFRDRERKGGSRA